MWEYLTIVSSPNHDLNEQGRLGWELVTVVPFGDGARFYFKRKAI
jgi:hypothetical protein